VNQPPRYLPARPFPPYAFLPGRDPHPTGDPAGHSYGHGPEVPPGYRPAGEWGSNEDYLYGIDLYNHGFLWEAHESWEGIWHPTKAHDAVQADFLQGLIQCAAAALKVPMMQPKGVERLTEGGTARLERVARAAGSPYMGLDVWRFLVAFRQYALGAPASIDDRPRIELE
jgi:uncharacterized protein